MFRKFPKAESNAETLPLWIQVHWVQDNYQITQVGLIPAPQLFIVIGCGSPSPHQNETKISGWNYLRVRWSQVCDFNA